jgi:hypothetical protein
MGMKIEFQELYNKFLEMYWDGDINNALKLDDRSRTDHQYEVNLDFDRPESFSEFVTQQSMDVSGQVREIYDAEEYWCVYLEKVFIVDEGTKVLRFEFGGAIHYPKSSPLPCKPGGMYSFSGRISSADYSWSHMNRGHIYAPYGFMNGVDFLCLDLVLKDATCTSVSGSVYTGRSFGLLGGERAEVPGQFSHPPLPGQFSHRPSASTSTSTSSSSGCFIATAVYGVDYNPELRVLYDFRDRTLAKSFVGRRCVSLYYVLSPPIARCIARSNWLRTRIRTFVLDPIVFLISTRRP